ncbi:hypothetical protein HXX76_014568 [Chlamydomonas incerta]|uniref:GST N-terminal domain-containing protein n=1 Tax=Chlamydomonas incerta TaxID=51695 RepID=A0A835SCC4_CHLIN|nr:hypothetical protein HXX76_014568 [Chlamydomonas incerta]|eukprot:KAG2424359.1 hypothetical protein HXX76_014568 [Chlamydomonas incerta]
MYRLHYFAEPGRAEIARLCFAIGEIPYEDVTYSEEEFAAAKSGLPFGQVPLLELPDGRRLAQSLAIDRFLAGLSGLLPADPWQAAQADMVALHMHDFVNLFTPSFFMPPAESLAAQRELLAGAAHTKLLQLATIVSQP